VLTDAVGAIDELGILRAGRRHPGQVTLDVRREDGHSRRSELLGEHLQRAGLAGAGGSRDEAVPIEHRDRDAHLHLRLRIPVDEGADLQHGAAEGVAGTDHFDGGRIEGSGG
jgi:hypothetical protein